MGAALAFKAVGTKPKASSVPEKPVAAAAPTPAAPVAPAVERRTASAAPAAPAPLVQRAVDLQAPSTVKAKMEPAPASPSPSRTLLRETAPSDSGNDAQPGSPKAVPDVAQGQK